VAVEGAAAVGAAFGGEGGVLERNLGAETRGEVVEDVVVAVADAIWLDLQRHVAVAEVVGDAGEQQRIRDASYAESFRGGSHQDGAAVVDFEHVAVREDAAAR
jgi:hypothetical protein